MGELYGYEAHERFYVLVEKILTADQKETITKYIKANPRGQGPGGRRFGPGAGAAAAPQP